MEIVETTNAVYKVTAFKMSNDSIIPNVTPPLNNQYNFFIIIVGKPMAGKSNLWLNLLNKRSKHTYYKKFEKVYIFSNSIHTITTEIKLNAEQIYHGIDKLEEVIETIKTDPEDGHNLIILDDLVCDIKNVDYVLKLIFNRRHIGGGISLIITSQVYNKINLPLRKCCTDLILFNTSNKLELESIFKDFINITKEDYHELIKYCFSGSNHDFIWIDTMNNRYYKNFNKLELTFA